MKRHLVRALVDSVVLIGLIAFCSGISPAQSAGRLYSRRNVQPATDRMERANRRWQKSLASAI